MSMNRIMCTDHTKNTCINIQGNHTTLIVVVKVVKEDHNLSKNLIHLQSKLK